MPAREQPAPASGKRLAAIVVAVVVSSCTGGTADQPAPSPPSVTTTTTSTTTTTEPSPPTTSPTTDTWQPPGVCRVGCSTDPEVVFEVAAGATGIGYADVGIPEKLAYGPSAVAVTDTGDVWIADMVDNQLERFDPEGRSLASIDLADYEVAGPVDLAWGPAGLLVLDVYPATERYRVVELDPDGALRAVHPLPAGLHLEDGLTGVGWGPDGEIWVELELGNRTAVLDGDTFVIHDGAPYPNGDFAPASDDPFAFEAGQVRVFVDSGAELGGLRLLGVNPDGSFVLLLDEVSQGADGSFQVAESVHLFDADGYHLAEGTFPLDDQFIAVDHPLVVAPDGYVYGLLTRPDRVVVARLAYTGGEEAPPGQTA